MNEEANTNLPPHNMEAEMAVIAAIFVDPGCLPEVTLVLKRPEMFWRTSHQHIYRAVQELSSVGETITFVSVGERLIKNAVIDECGGSDAVHNYLRDIVGGVPSSYGVERMANIVRDRSLMREVIHRASDIRAMANDPTQQPADVIEKLEQDVFEIAAARYHGETHSVQELIQQVMDQQATMKEFRLKHDGAGLPGLSSGYTDLDQFTTGWKSGELIVIGARPGQGKTSLMLNLAENMALETHERRDDGKGGVLVFSLEMTGTELIQRILCSNAGVDLRKVKLGLYNNEEEALLNDAMSKLAPAAIFVDDSFTLSMSEIRSKARRMKERHDIECIFVDYLQLVKDNDRLDRHLQIGNISRGMKSLARELEIPVVTAAQLNRSVEQRSSREKRPMLSDLRESGSIEQDADQVLMIHKLEEVDDPTINLEEVHPTDLLVVKNRNGPVGDVHMLFHKKFTRFNQRQHTPGNWSPAQA
ncbi:replicative DNA helicase [Planctomycetota bacterium]|nr:replicative DNA helicase [Planctomycetota bacterium]